MNRRVFLAALAGLGLHQPALARPRRDTHCEWLKTRLKHLDSRARQGQHPAQARRLRARRRRLRQEKFRICR
jgi:hypothetical protein